MKMTKIRKKEKDKKIAKQLTTKICQNKLTKNSPQQIDKFGKRTMTKIRHSKLTNSPKKKMTKIRQKENYPKIDYKKSPKEKDKKLPKN